MNEKTLPDQGKVAWQVHLPPLALPRSGLTGR